MEKIDGVSLYGSLLKIHRADIVGGYRIFEKTKLFTANYSGLTFARYCAIYSDLRSSNWLDRKVDYWPRSRSSAMIFPKRQKEF